MRSPATNLLKSLGIHRVPEFAGGNIAGVIRILRRGDEEALEAFLAPRAETSMFLRANSRAAGFEDRGEPMQATYAAAFEADAIVAVAAHCWNGVLLIQAPRRAGEVAHAAIDASGRRLTGIIGPVDQVRATRDVLALLNPRMDDADDLYSLDLAALRVPDQLERLSFRRPRESELPLLFAWREQYLVETKLAAPDPRLREEARSGIELSHLQHAHWVLQDGKRVVAYTAFNARLPDIVQVGGVWTPPDLRGRGYGRCAVAASLLQARAEGARRAILFTGNASGARAYEALGFVRTGGFGLLFV
jgi:predicted GNAT family acetyltransferase